MKNNGSVKVRSLMRAILFGGSLLATQALVVLFGLLIYQSHLFSQAPPSHFVPAVQPDEREELIYGGSPKQIRIPSLDINLAINDGSFNENSGEWDINNTDAFFATPTSLPNTSIGETLIYGHNIPAVFAKLHDLEPDAEVTVITDNDVELVYRFSEEIEVAPDDISQFDYDGEPTLTLQTCSGDWNEYRRLFSFELVDWSLTS